MDIKHGSCMPEKKPIYIDNLIILFHPLDFALILNKKLKMK